MNIYIGKIDSNKSLHKHMSYIGVIVWVFTNTYA